MEPDQSFSLLLRLFIEVTPKNVGSGCTIPVLFILHVAMKLRNVIGEHSNEDTGALAQYLHHLFEVPDEKEFARVFAKALGVDVSCIDIKGRVVVRRCFLLSCGVEPWRVCVCMPPRALNSFRSDSDGTLAT